LFTYAWYENSVVSARIRVLVVAIRLLFNSEKGVAVVASAITCSSPVLDSEVSGTIVSLRERFEAVRRNEIRRVRGRLGNLSSDQENVVESLSRGIIEKVLQAPVEMLLTVETASQSASILETVRKIFNLTT
jgi:glutamyl-tRNA reductase